MIDHIGLPVGDMARATEFYMKALAPLGIGMIMEIPADLTPADTGAAAGFGADNKPFFWIGEAPVSDDTHVHVAFTASSRADVDAFHQAALAAGGTDNGAPGLRPEYHENYYGAFVLDPDGNNIEAVCHAPA
jgi:catechol 2,3-dioxygenase-like lactoylglutathione lyase family enzyme